MTLSELSVRRPVLATVLSLLIIAFGAIAFTRLPLRELPDVDRPVVSVDVTYRGASAQVVETQVVRIIEDQLSGIEGIDVIRGTSRDGRGSIVVEFDLNRDIEAATNDVRNAVSRARGQLPTDIDEPVVQKADADADPIMWFSFYSTTMDRIALTDYAQRYIVDQRDEQGFAQVHRQQGFSLDPFRLSGISGHDHYHRLASSHALLDNARPGRAIGDALDIDPGVESCLVQGFR